FHILQGMETLGLRMQRHVDNTREIASFLQQQDTVAAVSYPELEGHPDRALAARLLPRGCGAVLSFELQGGRQAATALVDALSLFSHLANVGDARSLVIHPASTTHHRMDAAALQAAGIADGTIRLSVGLEQVSDLIADLKQGLRAAEKAVQGVAR
ncbi:MAG: PLP-dependent transferase, partial [Halieaceae bacterium]|nr:PLP-dependent transferase [Halieaceae bacterium]